MDRWTLQAIELCRRGLQTGAGMDTGLDRWTGVRVGGDGMADLIFQISKRNTLRSTSGTEGREQRGEGRYDARHATLGVDGPQDYRTTGLGGNRKSGACAVL
jgi:hypothetical protein